MSNAAALRRLPRPGSPGLVLLLGALTAAGPLSTDLYLACFPDLIDNLRTTPAAAQLTLSAFTFFFGLGGLVIGPLADALGRRPVLLGGFCLYLLASLACMVSPTIDTLIALRAVQAVGAATGPVIARAVVRDLHDGHEAGRLLGLMAATMGIIPAIAPSLGAAVLDLGGWRIQFLIMAIVAGLALIMVFRYLGETLSAENTQALSPGPLLAKYVSLFREARFLLPVAVGALSFSGLFAFISGGTLVLQNVYHQSPTEFGLSFGLVVIGFMAGTTTGGRSARWLGSARLVQIGTCILAASALAMVIGISLGVASPFMILVPMMGYTFGLGLVGPQTAALSLMPYPHMAGTASALNSALSLGFAALVGLSVGQTYDGTAWPMVRTIAFVGCSAFVLMIARVIGEKLLTNRAGSDR